MAIHNVTVLLDRRTVKYSLKRINPIHLGQRAHVQAASKAGEDIRQVGSDIKQGQLVLQAGDMLDAPEIGILATVGATSVQVSGFRGAQHVMSWALMILRSVVCCTCATDTTPVLCTLAQLLVCLLLASIYSRCTLSLIADRCSHLRNCQAAKS